MEIKASDVGKKIWDFRYGEGVIIKFTKHKYYPVWIEFKALGGLVCYTTCGRHWSKEHHKNLKWIE